MINPHNRDLTVLHPYNKNLYLFFRIYFFKSHPFLDRKSKIKADLRFVCVLLVSIGFLETSEKAFEVNELSSASSIRRDECARPFEWNNMKRVKWNDRSSFRVSGGFGINVTLSPFILYELSLWPSGVSSSSSGYYGNSKAPKREGSIPNFSMGLVLNNLQEIRLKFCLRMRCLDVIVLNFRAFKFRFGYDFEFYFHNVKGLER